MCVPKYGHTAPEGGYTAGPSAGASYLIESALGVTAQLLQQLRERAELSQECAVGNVQSAEVQQKDDLTGEEQST